MTARTAPKRGRESDAATRKARAGGDPSRFRGRAGTTGDLFRTAFEAEFEPPSFEIAPVLDAVCSTLDTIERLEADIEQHGLKTEGSMGQPVINPSVPELRQQRAALSRLLKELPIDDEDDPSSVGRALASLRYRKRKAS